MDKKTLAHFMKRQSTEAPLEAVFAAKTIQEAEASAGQWVLANVPPGWHHDFVHTAQSLAHSPTPAYGKKAALDECAVKVKISPARDADPKLIACVRDAIAKLPSQRP